MANKYFSISRRYIAKQVYKTTVPAAAIGEINISSGHFQNRMFPIDNVAVNTNSNIVCRNLGIFSNFADGLVFKEPHQSIQMQIYLELYWDNPATPLETGTIDNDQTPFKLYTANGADPTIYDTPQVLIRREDKRYCYRVANPGAGGEIPLYDVAPWVNTTDSQFKLLTLIGLDYQAPTIDIPTLNEMHPYEHIFRLSDYNIIAPQQVDYIVMSTIIYCPYDLDFLTKSISPDFEGDEIFFDAAIDIETTKRYS